MGRKFKLIAVVACSVAGLSGCGTYRETVADISSYDKVCIDHVEYLQFPHGVTVQRNQHGGVVLCK